MTVLTDLTETENILAHLFNILEFIYKSCSHATLSRGSTGPSSPAHILHCVHASLRHYYLKALHSLSLHVDNLSKQLNDTN